MLPKLRKKNLEVKNQARLYPVKNKEIKPKMMRKMTKKLLEQMKIKIKFQKHHKNRIIWNKVNKIKY